MESDFQPTNTKRLEAVIERLMDNLKIDDPEEAAKLIDSGEFTIDKPVYLWSRQNDVIRYTVTSENIDGTEWSAYDGFVLSDHARSILKSEHFKPTSDVITEITILIGEEIFRDDRCFLEHIKFEGKFRNLISPNLEVACITGKMLTYKDFEKMGIEVLLFMHTEVSFPSSGKRVLSLSQDSGCQDKMMLCAHVVSNNHLLKGKYGFAFVSRRWTLTHSST